MADTTDTPQPFSFSGWNFSAWLGKNKDTLKLLVAFLVGYNYFTGFDWKSFIAVLLAMVGKLVIDSIDYYQSE